MPELPEVETIKSEIESILINKKIKNLKINDIFLKNTQSEVLYKKIINNSFKKIKRIGKLIYLEIDNDNFLICHLGMTGKLIITKNKEIINQKHSHLVIFYDDFSLVFNDQRRFGYVSLVNKNILEKIIQKYGIEPLTPNFTFDNFKKLFKGKRILKAILLDQSKISGIGNIYADEICFDAGVMQNRTVNSLSEAEIKKLFISTEKIIDLAIKNKGTTFSDYRNTENKKGNFQNFLKVFTRENKNCLVCKNKIEKTKIIGRGTYFCKYCQK